jgi:polyketide biosynthesis acyl carrier protein
MAKRQLRIVTGLTGLLVATGINSLLSEPGNRWVGSAYAQDAESWDEEADTWEADESSAEEAGDGESMEESAWTEDDSVVEEEESEPVEEADDSEATASADEAAADESVAEELAEPESAPTPQDEPQSQLAPEVHDKADRVREVLYQHTREVLPDLASHDFKGSDSLRALGANSVDRSEILMLTLETLSLNVPMIEFAKAENLDELARLIAAKMP